MSHDGNIELNEKELEQCKEEAIKEFQKREAKWLKSGGKFLLPYPSFRVVK